MYSLGHADFNFLSKAIFKVSNREIHPRVGTGEITDEVTFDQLRGGEIKKQN